MVRELKPVDVGGLPELLRIAEEVNATGIPCVLTRGNEELAIITPARRPRRARRKTGVLTKDDALFDLIGIGRSDGPGDIAANKHKYLAEAYKRHHG